MAISLKPAPPMLFLNVGWATEYRGGLERPVGKFRYITDGNQDIGEGLNFRIYSGRCYGYAPVPSRAVNVVRLGAVPNSEYVDGVLVVWTATHPVQRGSYIVGWYRHARVWAKMRLDRPDSARPDFITEAAAKDCILIPPDRRTFWIPTKRTGWPGQSSSFYASENLSRECLAKLRSYTDGKEPNSVGFAKPEEAAEDDDPSWPTLDPDLRAKVEAAAVTAVIAHFREDAWTVKSVEKENVGWDLEVTKVHGHLRLCVEVKGRGGVGPVELTPREFKAMKRIANRPYYRLAIVHHALSSTPKLTIFQWVGRRGWVGDNGEALKLVPMTGAVARFTSSESTRRTARCGR